MRCAKCSNTNVSDPNVKFHCVPSLPAKSKAKKLSFPIEKKRYEKIY